MSELEEELTRKNEVLSELMEEHVALKKRFGETCGIFFPTDRFGYIGIGV